MGRKKKLEDTAPLPESQVSVDEVQDIVTSDVEEFAMTEKELADAIQESADKAIEAMAKEEAEILALPVEEETPEPVAEIPAHIEFTQETTERVIVMNPTGLVKITYIQ